MLQMLHGHRWSTVVEAITTGTLGLLLLTTLPVGARARPVAAPQLELTSPAPQRMEKARVNNQTIAPLDPAVQRIEAPSALPTPAMTAAPVTASPLLPRDSRDKALERELQQLQRAAAPASGYGSTAVAAQAAWQLGLIHLHGAGVRVDQALALQWFERSTSQGREPWAFAGLAWCAIDGCTGPPNPAAATRAIQRLRAAHPGRADFLSWLQAARLNPLQIATPGQAKSTDSASLEMQLLERAAAADDVQANIELGIMAFSNRQLSQAQAYFRRAAPRSAIATHNLQVLQENSRAMSGPVAPASNTSAQFALDMAHMYHRGLGVPANFSEAVRFYRLAEQRGSKEAHKMLELIFSRPMPDGSLNPAWMQQLANADLNSQGLTLGSGVNAAQMQREPSPLFDLLAPSWQKQVLQIAQ